MPSTIRYPSYLVLRIPTRYRLLERIDLTDSITLCPGKRYEQPPEDREKFFGCTVLYIEKNPPAEQFGPPTWPKVVSYKNLREFVVFWSFLMRESWAIPAFERGDGPVLQGTPPNELPSYWDNGPPPLDSHNIRIENHSVALDWAFAIFRRAGTTKDLAALLMYEPNRYVEEPSRIVYDNYHFKTSLLWFVFDALVPPDRCTVKVACPKCKQDTELSHPRESFRTRAERALSGFSQAEQYATLLDKLRTVRGKFVHSASIKDFPETNYPDVDPHTGDRRREVTLDETLKFFGLEGLATTSAIIIAYDIAYWLVFNRILPDLNIWPRIGNLKMVSTG